MNELTAAFTGAHGPSWGPAVAFLLTWPDHFGSAATYDLDYGTAGHLLVVTVRYHASDIPPGGQWRHDFWCGRFGGKIVPASQLKDAAFQKSHGTCELRLHRLTAKTWADAVGKIAYASTAVVEGKKLPRPGHVLEVHLGGTGGETLIVGAKGTSLFIPGVQAPVAGDEFDVRLCLPNQPPATTGAVVTTVSRTTKPPGFYVQLPEVSSELQDRLKKHLAERAPPPAGPDARRTATRFPMRAPVAVAVAAPGTALPRTQTVAPGTLPPGAAPKSGAFVSPPRTPAAPAPRDALPRTQTVQNPAFSAPARAPTPSPTPMPRPPSRTVTPPAPAPETARLSYVSSEAFMADYVENLSKGGAFIRTVSPPALDSKLSLEIALPDATVLRVPALVVHIGNGGFGVQFVLDEAMDAALDAVITRLAAPKKRALVVGLDEALPLALASRGYDVLTADQGEAALHVLLEETLGLDVLVTELEMPVMNGAQLVDTVRRVGGDTELGIVVVAGPLGDDHRAWLAARNVDAVLERTMGPDAIARAADDAAAARRARRV